MLRGLRRVTVQYAPLLPGSSSLVEFFAECMTQRALRSNPDCAVHLTLLERGAPSLVVEFSTGEKLSMDTSNARLEDLKSTIEEKQQDIRTLQLLREEGYQLDGLKPEEVPDLEGAKAMTHPEGRKLYEGLKPVEQYKMQK